MVTTIQEALRALDSLYVAEKDDAAIRDMNGNNLDIEALRQAARAAE